ncbi:UNVERIFIED_CONTAM: protein TRANSPORT INHIBITOR RESPONSE 1 [Sesamum radiatum]|uniref:Protein TRANSPORT INHIBITOR RESPONSE 1 n=1 Tax=Sesamum radiatum TaxID=300843 RepID=A0AAW2K485_SESRA
MDPDPKKSKFLPSNLLNSNGSSHPQSLFPDEVLEKVLSLIDSHKDRNSVSLVCKDWYNAERWTRSNLFIGNCYSVSPEIVARRFPKIKCQTQRETTLF